MSNLIRLSTVAFFAFALVGCLGGEEDAALKPLSPETLSDLASKGMPVESQMLVRIFKEEAELEVWKDVGGGEFALFKVYPICAWSGRLGPKIREGDRQAPEGYYVVTPALMNPRSQYHLAFNLGFPNAFDRSLGRTGAYLMVHGDCSSRGCYAMTNPQIEEIYGLARESFKGGQRNFNVHAYPFRMNEAAMARHSGSEWIGFWRNIKEGYDYFEATRRLPSVSESGGKYVFNAGGQSLIAAGYAEGN